MAQVVITTIKNPMAQYLIKDIDTGKGERDLYLQAEICAACFDAALLSLLRTLLHALTLLL